MAGSKISWNNGRKKFANATDPTRLVKTMEAEMRRASALVGKVAEREIRALITSGKAGTGNAPLTIALKGENHPLVGDTAALYKAITSKALSSTSVFVGVLRTDPAANIAAIVHEGASVPVTPAMRGMFFYLWKASQGEFSPSKLSGRAKELWDKMPGGWKPIAASTKAIVIPGRPFVEIAFQSSGLRTEAKELWEKALAQAIRKASAGG